MSHTFDPDQNWIARKEAEEARRAMEDQRHARNARIAEVLAVAIVVTAVVFCLSVAYRDGLFRFLEAAR